MWVRLTFGNIQPDKLEEVRKIYYEEIVPAVKAQKGNVDIFLLESISEKGDFISFTAWENKEDADAYETSGRYKKMVHKVEHMFTAPPILRSYEVKK
jgi:quinol monooxygenase YgiN